MSEFLFEDKDELSNTTQIFISGVSSSRSEQSLSEFGIFKRNGWYAEGYK